MKVSNDSNAMLMSELAGSRNVRKKGESTLSQPLEKTESSDGYSVKLSAENSTARKIAAGKAKAIATATDPVREDRVRQLKEQIANGTYKVDSGKVADGILKEAIRDEIAKNPSEVYLG